jgi:UDP:flavonoid glycosyltransferase YjiC (YdhE family)
MLSPHLNIQSEPPEFLAPEGRASFDPVAFYGSVLRRPLASGTWFSGDGRTRVYVSFGSYLFLAFRKEFVAALTRVVDGLAAADGVEALVSLGAPDADEETVASFVRPNVRVEQWVDQPAVLAQADVYVTHHGIASTHDAIDQRVPMLSLPFFGDQPSQAALCQSLGIALPLGTPTALPEVGEVGAAVARVGAHRAQLLESLEVVRGWEDAVIAGRPAVIAQIRALAAAHR